MTFSYSFQIRHQKAHSCWRTKIMSLQDAYTLWSGHNHGEGVQPGCRGGASGPPLWMLVYNKMYSFFLKDYRMQVPSVISKSFQEPWTFFPFYCHVFQTVWGRRKGVCKTKPDMQQRAVKGPLCWSHCSASKLMLCFPNKSQVLKE